jgi:hypothetical protein
VDLDEVVREMAKRDGGYVILDLLSGFQSSPLPKAR